MGHQVILYVDFYREYVLYRDGAAKYRPGRTWKYADRACGDIDIDLSL